MFFPTTFWQQGGFSFGNYLLADGVNDGVTINTSDALFDSSSDFGISVWIKAPVATKATAAICSFKSGGSNPFLMFFSNSNSYKDISFGTKTSKGRIIGTGYEDVWIHLVINRTSAGVYSCKVNDSTSTVTTTGSYGTLANTNTLFNFGGSFNGQMGLDEMAVYDSLISDAEATALYNNSKGADAASVKADPILHYKFNETGGTTLSDSSANGYNGTLNNFTGTYFLEHT
jgi:hypothetical protein